jgi:hypothetical protein
MIKSRSWEISAWKPNDSVAMVFGEWVRMRVVGVARDGEEDAGSAKKIGAIGRPSYKVLRR